MNSVTLDDGSTTEATRRKHYLVQFASFVGHPDNESCKEWRNLIGAFQLVDLS